MGEPSILPIRRQAAEALRRARKLPIGHARNDLRQVALGLLWREKRGYVAIPEDLVPEGEQRAKESALIGAKYGTWKLRASRPAPLRLSRRQAARQWQRPFVCQACGIK